MDIIEKEFYKLYIILTSIPESQKQRIPKELFDYLARNMKVDEMFEIDINKSLLEQSDSPITKGFLVEIFSRYISDDKEKWKKYSLICRNLAEKEKTEKNIPNVLSQHNRAVEIEKMNEHDEKESSNLLIQKEGIINKIINYIRKIISFKHN